MSLVLSLARCSVLASPHWHSRCKKNRKLCRQGRELYLKKTRQNTHKPLLQPKIQTKNLPTNQLKSPMLSKAKDSPPPLNNNNNKKNVLGNGKRVHAHNHIWVTLYAWTCRIALPEPCTHVFRFSSLPWSGIFYPTLNGNKYVLLALTIMWCFVPKFCRSEPLRKYLKD